jgi:catechol 1,2-dioxygenase
VSSTATATRRPQSLPTGHIHYEIHHPDLIKPSRGEVYFSGDPDDIAAHGFVGPFDTAVFDFFVTTRTSPETVVRPQETV